MSVGIPGYPWHFEVVAVSSEAFCLPTSVHRNEDTPKHQRSHLEIGIRGANGFSSESISLGIFPLMSKRTSMKLTQQQQPTVTNVASTFTKIPEICTVNSASFTRALSPMLVNKPSISLHSSCTAGRDAELLSHLVWRLSFCSVSCFKRAWSCKISLQLYAKSIQT